jgi:hypothetical protein
MGNHIVVKRWYGGLCNNIVQLCHAVYVAEITRSYLEIPSHWFLATHDFDFTDGKSPEGVVAEHFFWLDKTVFDVAPMDWNLRRKILNTYIRPMLPCDLFANEGDESGLTIYIRSGDVFCRKSTLQVLKQAKKLKTGIRRVLFGTHRVNAFYIQPPLAFYNLIIEQRKWSRIQIVAQDLENPVISALIDRHEQAEYVPGNLGADINKLLSAQNLVIGYGTFGMVWALLSSHLESLYSPVLPEEVFGHLYPGDLNNLEINSFEFSNYIPRGQWRATRRQKKMMLNYQVDNIVRAT